MAHIFNQAPPLGEQRRARSPAEGRPKLALIHQSILKLDLLRHCAESCWGLDVVVADSTVEKAIRSIAHNSPHLVIASLNVPNTQPGALVKHFTSILGPSPLIGVTSVCSEFFVNAVTSAAYRGLVYEEDETINSIGSAIRCVLDGGRYVSRSILMCQTRLRSTPDSFPKVLSSREQSVLLCIARSMSDAEIALELGIAQGTALVHRRRIMHKLNVHSTPKLVNFCIRKGFYGQ